MKIICKYKGGIHSYGLANATSDIDWRGVFINTDINQIIGLERHDHQVKQTDASDDVYYELRHVLNLLKGANTMAVELLYNDVWESRDLHWALVMQHRDKLVSSEKLFSALRGYMQGELKRANGESTGKLGGKRKDAIEQHGFSPKNFVQFFRLAMCGRVYFQKGYFPVNIAKENQKFAAWLMDIKTKPDGFSIGYLNDEAKKAEEMLVLDYEARKHATQFDDAIANQLCLQIYGPMITASLSTLVKPA